MSQVEVDKIIPQSGTTLTIGDNGDTIAIASGATLTSFASTGIDDNATSTAITIDSSGNVGISATSISTVGPNHTTLQINGTTTDRTGSLRLRSNNGSVDSALWGSTIATYFGTISNHPLQIWTNNSERMRIDTSGNVGIGETAPLGKVHIKQNDSGVTSAPAFADALFIEDSSNTGITICTPTNGIGSIAFGDSGDNDIGKFQYQHSDNSMLFVANAAERMRIDSSGNVGIGTASPSQKLDVSGSLNVTGTGNFVASGTRRVEVSGDGFSTFTGSPILDGGIEFTNQFGHVYSIGVSNGDNLRIYDGGTELLRVAPSGVLFNGAGSYLDDYEEGTYTAVLTTSTGATVPLTSIKILSYTKIGRQVHIQGLIRLGTITSLSGGFFQITLPFTSASGITLYGARGGGGIFYNDAGTYSVVPFGFSENQTKFNVQKDSSTLGTSDDLQIAFSYLTD